MLTDVQRGVGAGLLAMLAFAPFPPRVSAADAAHKIKDVPYRDMSGGFCTPTVLRMNFEFYGNKIPATVIQNWSWNYGFHLSDDGRIAFPTTDPVEQIEHAAGVMGYDVQVYDHNDLPAATARIKSLVAQDVPAIVQWIPHTVLAVGYNKDHVLIHDPEDVDNALQAQYFGRGAYFASRPENWLRPPALWNIRDYLVIALRPAQDSVQDWRKVDWRPILNRNAQRTLGGQERKSWFGVAAIRQLAKRPSGNMPLTGYFGWTARENAAEFLLAQDDPQLQQAGQHFHRSAELFKEIYQGGRNVRRNLEQIADEEEQAARLMPDGKVTVKSF